MKTIIQRDRIRHPNRKRESQHDVIGCRIRLFDCVADCVWLPIPQLTEWQRIGNQIDPAMIFARRTS